MMATATTDQLIVILFLCQLGKPVSESASNKFQGTNEYRTTFFLRSSSDTENISHIIFAAWTLVKSQWPSFMAACNEDEIYWWEFYHSTGNLFHFTGFLLLFPFSLLPSPAAAAATSLEKYDLRCCR